MTSDSVRVYWDNVYDGFSVPFFLDGVVMTLCVKGAGAQTKPSTHDCVWALHNNVNQGDYEKDVKAQLGKKWKLYNVLR